MLGLKSFDRNLFLLIFNKNKVNGLFNHASSNLLKIYIYYTSVFGNLIK